MILARYLLVRLFSHPTADQGVDHGQLSLLLTPVESISLCSTLMYLNLHQRYSDASLQSPRLVGHADFVLLLPSCSSNPSMLR